MRISRSNLRLIISALAVLGTLSAATALGMRNMPRSSKISPFGGGVADSGRDKARDGERSGGGGNVLLSASADEDSYKPGEPVMIALTLSNYTDKEIYLVETRAIKDYQLEIKKVTGEKLRLSERGKKVLESEVLRRILSRIEPRETVRNQIDISELYDLSAADTYIISVARKILMYDKKSTAEIRSDPAKIVIRP